jgi:DNA-binding transcriptional MerR regulator
MSMLKDRPTGERTYATSQVVALLGVSYRRIDYWARMGYIPGQHDVTGSGHRRYWTEDQIDRVRLLMMASELKSSPLDDLAERISNHTDCPLVA